MKKLIYLDSCQPDYFQGFSGEVLIAFHWKGQTVSELIESLELNANNEGHEAEVYDAIHNFKELNQKNKDQQAINENFCEFDENGVSGLVHYFGLVDQDEE